MSISGGIEQFPVHLSASVHDKSIRQVFVIPWKSLRRQQKRQTLDAVGGGCKETMYGNFRFNGYEQWATLLAIVSVSITIV